MYKLRYNGKNNYSRTLFYMLLIGVKKGINYYMLLFFIISIFLIIICVFMCSEIRFSINYVQILSSNEENVFEYKGKAGLYFFNKIKLFSVKLNNNKTRKILEKRFFKEKVLKAKNIPKSKKKVRNRMIKHIIKNTQIKALDLKLNIDTQSVILTSYLVGLISTIIPNIIRNNIKNINMENYKFQISPLYKNQNYLYVKLNCIISIKVVHIINIILKQGGIKNERSSNRRFNVNCYGKY